MRHFHSLRSIAASAAVGASLALSASAQSYTYTKPLVDSESLQATLSEDALFARAQVLEDFAFGSPERNRRSGSTGHNKTVDYIYDTIAGLGDYYDVQKQQFSVLITGGNASLTANGTDQGARLLTYTPSGEVVEPFVVVANRGCNATDYPSTLAGAIALVSRGSCEFGLKSALAGAAGAVGAVIYNNVDGPLSGTLGPDERPEGRYVPTVGISLANGTALVSALTNSSQTILGNLSVQAFANNITTNNVLATTKMGDQANVYQVGGHSDSVGAGPGINDDGSGIVALLELAVQLSKFSVNNAVRFSFWAAEEEGLVGSTYYTDTASNGTLADIRLYNNFDMIASPNYVYAVYDGDGSAFNLSGPIGSAEAEQLFIDWFASEGIPTIPTEFSGRSDYQGFIDKGIPASGLFTGAEGIKNDEEAALFGGEAGVAYDVNYHLVGDDVSNVNGAAWLVNSRAIAHTLGTYGVSWDGFPTRNGTNSTSLVRRSVGGGARRSKNLLEGRWDGQSLQKEVGRKDVGLKCDHKPDATI